jgi:hypothetical protein
MASPAGADNPVTNWIDEAATHWPDAQISPPPQACPHVPQLAVSLDVSLHPDAHCARPAGQTATHFPCEQVLPVRQGVHGHGPAGSSVFQQKSTGVANSVQESVLAPAVQVDVPAHCAWPAPWGTLHAGCSE